MEGNVSKSRDRKSELCSGVSTKTYWKYFQSGAGAFSLALFIFNLLIAEFFFCASDYWLSLWTATENARWLNSRNNLTSSFEVNFSSKETRVFQEENRQILRIYNWVLERNTAIYVYSIVIVGVFIFGYLRAAHFYSIAVRASLNLHDAMFNAIIRSPVDFFGKNPVGKSDSVCFEILK